MAFEEEELRRAFELTGGVELGDISAFVDVLLLLRDGEEEMARALIGGSMEGEEGGVKADDEVLTVDVVKLVRRDGREDDGGESDRLMVASRICQRCDGREINSALLPCGHLSFCSICATTEETCLVCDEYFSGFVLFF